MPRKKAEPGVPALGPEVLPAAIACPACKSKIGSDGKTLHEKSAYLDELIETDAGVDQVEKKIEKMEKTIAAHVATIADLRAQLEAATKKPLQEKEKPSVQNVQKGRAGNGDAKPKREPWASWD